MTSLINSTARLRTLHTTLQKLDPPSAAALEAHIATAADADAVLRECGIQLAALQTLQVANGQPTGFTTAMRNRIDVLIGAVPAPQPISQVDGS